MPTLPRNARALTISTFDSRLDPIATLCDLRDLSFIDAYGLVGTTSALRAGLIEMPDLRVLSPVSGRTGAHLTSMGFREFLHEHDLSPDLPDHRAADVSGVVVPLRSARAAGGDQALSHLLWEQLRAHVDPQVLAAVAEGVHEPIDELEAIHLALEYLVTSVPDDPGRGQGLFTTMEQVVRLQGQMHVRSGDSLVVIDDAGKVSRKVEPIPGVIVALSLPLYPGEHR